MNKIQKRVLEYMDEALSQEDDYIKEAWSSVERFVLDSLEEVEIPHPTESICFLV